MMKLLRKILFPLALLYDGVTRIRNFLYDNSSIKNTSFDLPVICVGNLNVGGTGKTPMIEFLIRHLKDEYRVAVLSRGYKRKTSGFYDVKTTSTAEEVGDEPLQFKQKFPDVTVAVDANRVRGIGRLQKNADLILLDDAFQHRKVKPSFSILLTAYSDLYTDDMVLPAGNLRESAIGAKRADCIVVTKCPLDISKKEQQRIIDKLHPEPYQQVFFAGISYADVIQNQKEERALCSLKDKPFTLVTGIANPAPLVDFLRNKGFEFSHLQFADHHHFTKTELENLSRKECIVTTEKDYVRLAPFLNNPLFYLPIKTTVINAEINFIKIFKKHISMF